ncbi:MAG: GNAT family N-acetyltransferase [Pseudomonadota bacterium]
MVTVRRAVQADAQALLTLLNGIIRRGGTTAMQYEWSIGEMTALIANPECLVNIAEDRDSGAMLGFQYIEPEDRLPKDMADIATFVAPDGTRSGVGRALTDMTCAEARSLGWRALDATIRADNPAGLAFYDAMGFRDYHVYRSIPLSDGTPVDRISKKRNLD